MTTQPDKDTPVKLDVEDPEAALRALLAVDPESDPVSEDEAPGEDE